MWYNLTVTLSYIKESSRIKECVMKNTIFARFVHIFGIIALVAVIGFSMAACDPEDNGGDDNGPKLTVPTWAIGTWERDMAGQYGSRIAITSSQLAYTDFIYGEQSGETLTFDISSIEEDILTFSSSGGSFTKVRKGSMTDTIVSFSSAGYWEYTKIN
jgi:hypothetical protein